MIKNNFFGTVLIVLLILFLLVASVQMLGIGNKIKEIEEPADVNATLPQIKQNDSVQLADNAVDDKKMMELIQARPMFSSDRVPYTEPVEEEVAAEPPVEINDLKAKLTAVVITPENRYVMIHDELTNEKQIYKEGMPLDGEQGGWSLTEINPRKVLLTSEDNRTQELELEVFAAKAGASAKPSKARNKQKSKDDDLKARLEKKKTAEDIRKKIAERRAKMRAEALQKK